jgi:hypothetical protein
MEIEYLKALQNIYNVNKKLSRIGVSEFEISNLENSLNLKLPKAYKEFLFIAGKRDNILDGWNRGYDDLEFMQEYAHEAFQRVGLQMKPFWCFAEYNDADSSLFFFLDEGDNPSIYNFVADKVILDDNGEEVYYKKTHESFSAFIDKKIESALK